MKDGFSMPRFNDKRFSNSKKRDILKTLIATSNEKQTLSIRFLKYRFSFIYGPIGIVAEI